ncbi:MAG: replication factor C small subunit [Desulfurococcaceae archaeon]
MVLKENATLQVSNLSELLWAEKYRPRALDDVVNQKEIVDRLKKFVGEKNIPHMLFAGPPGTGKTTVAHALAHDLYGENYRQFMLELNASDERKIEVIRTKVKEFARSRVVGEVPFKIVLLDEADNMTSDAQQALRRLMELYSANTRFILTANYPSKIIEPIQSRCAVFRFTALKKEDVVSRLAFICSKEKVKCYDKALELIYELSEGDMRRAINILQASAALGDVTEEVVYKVTGLAHPMEVREMLQNALSGNFEAARRKLRDLIINYGLSGLDVVKQVHKEIFSADLKVPDELRIMIADLAGEIQFRLVEGADDEIQLNAFLARIALIGRKLKV